MKNNNNSNNILDNIRRSPRIKASVVSGGIIGNYNTINFNNINQKEKNVKNTIKSNNKRKKFNNKRKKSNNKRKKSNNKRKNNNELSQLQERNDLEVINNALRGFGFVSGGKPKSLKIIRPRLANISNISNAARSGPIRTDLLFHLNGVQPRTKFNHVHIGPNIFGLRNPKSPAQLITFPGGHGVAKLYKAVNQFNKVAVPLAITVQTGVSIYKDCGNGTSRNTVETFSGVAGGWVGGYWGAVGGAAIGTAIFPGVGTIIGGGVGAISGGIAGSKGAEAAVNAIGDACDYDIIEKKCKKCGEKFRVRKYRGEKNIELCQKC